MGRHDHAPLRSGCAAPAVLLSHYVANGVAGAPGCCSFPRWWCCWAARRRRRRRWGAIVAIPPDIPAAARQVPAHAARAPLALLLFFCRSCCNRAALVAGSAHRAGEFLPSWPWPGASAARLYYRRRAAGAGVLHGRAGAHWGRGLARGPTTSIFTLACLLLFVPWSVLVNWLLNGCYRAQVLADVLPRRSSMRLQALQFTPVLVGRARQPAHGPALAAPGDAGRSAAVGARHRLSRPGSARQQRLPVRFCRCRWRCATICWPALDLEELRRQPEQAGR